MPTPYLTIHKVNKTPANTYVTDEDFDAKDLAQLQKVGAIRALTEEELALYKLTNPTKAKSKKSAVPETGATTTTTTTADTGATTTDTASKTAEATKEDEV